MKLLNKLLRPIPLLALVLAVVLLTIFTLTRIGLLIYTGIDSVPPALWSGIFFKGLKVLFGILVCDPRPAAHIGDYFFKILARHPV